MASLALPRMVMIGAFVSWSAALRAQPAKPLRELATDRPDRTESPITVDWGHSQLELELVSFARRPSVTVLEFLNVNWKMGLSPTVDLQFVMLAHERVRFGSGTATTNFPDLTVRLKKNLWGNDEGRSAFGLMPFVTLQRGGEYAGGLIAPWSRELNDAWSMGAMAEVDVSSTSDAVLVGTATLGRSLTETLGAFFELAGETRRISPESYEWTVDAGLTRRVGANIQLDAGLNVGVTYDEVRAFVGFSRRY